MQKLFCLFITALLLTACRSAKNVAPISKPQTPMVVTETVIQLESPASQKHTLESLETLEPSDGNLPLEVPEIIDDNNQYERTDVVVDVEPDVNFDHSILDNLLATYVSSEGTVDYTGMKNNWKTLRNYIESLGTNMPTDFWTQEDKLAYWMNAYNAMTIDLILRNYPLESIKDIKDPWDQRFWKLGNKWYNLNEIEHEILRKMGDARIHFGINCASFSCPPLLNEAFTAQKVDSQLDALSLKFINDPKRNTITSERVDVSKIFTWFSEDFKTDGTLIDFLNKYSETQISTSAKVRYMDYDWSLNK